MSFLPSLLFYNPLEALMLILFCDVFTKRKFKKTDLLHCFGLGIINFVFQYASMLMTNSIFILIYDFALVFGTIFILFFYYKILIFKNIKPLHCIYALIFTFVTTPFVCSVYNALFGNIYNLGFDNKLNELLVNLTLRVLQFVVILIIKSGVNKFEKGKGNAKESSRRFD